MLKEQVCEFSQDPLFVAIGICEKPEWQEKRSPGDNELIRQYNAALREEFGGAFVDPNELGSAEDVLISDGIHFTKQTHVVIAETLKRMLA